MHDARLLDSSRAVIIIHSLNAVLLQRVGLKQAKIINDVHRARVVQCSIEAALLDYVNSVWSGRRAE